MTSIKSTNYDWRVATMTNFVVEVRFVIVTPLHPHFFEERYALGTVVTSLDLEQRR